jgi:hypothetical protein
MCSPLVQAFSMARRGEPFGGGLGEIDIIYALNNSFALVAAGAVRVRWIGRKVGVAMRDPNSRS